jgi:serine protease
MNRLIPWQPLILLWLLVTMLVSISVNMALAQDTTDTPASRIFLPLVAGGGDAQAEVPGPEQAITTVDQIIVHYQEAEQAGFVSQATQMATLSAAAGTELTHVRELADRSVVVRLPQPLSPAALQPILERMTDLPEVLVAEPDLRLFPQLLPNDPRYDEQWHYFAPDQHNFGVNMPGAWDVTTGASNLVIAVLDTGQLAHEDIDATRIVPGYDFIASAFAANDGDGRDPNPSDAGDGGACGMTSTWHGTHVAGTIAAKSNNGRGVTGINWNSKIQHVRVLGICGGVLSDIIDAIYWAAGLDVPDAPRNPTPAKVLNLSLGNRLVGACSVSLQNAINAAVNVGAVVVVSAGNEGGDAADFLPANCNNVIAVAATDRSGDLPFYSNRGATLEIAAPGGFTTMIDDVNGVLSTLNTGLLGPEADTYGFYQGTSMAAPHVTGIVSLMLSVNPSLTPAQVLNILQSTATPFPAGSGCLPNNCGSGLVNAMAAVTKAKGGVMAPSYTQVTMAAATQIALRWTDNTSDESGFKVERCQGINCTNFTQIATLGANQTSYTDAGVVANTSYSYRVRTTKNGVDSTPSNVATTNSGVTGCALYNSYTQGARTIPDFGSISVTFPVLNHGTIQDVNLRNLTIEHSFDMDLAAMLTSPAGTQVELFSAVGGAGANFNGTTLDDEATTAIADGNAPFNGSYRPTNPLSAFDNQATAGTWSLNVSDMVGFYVGWFYGASLELCTSGSGGGGGTTDLIFEDGFESGNFGRWSATSTLDGGDLSVNTAAALVGTRGMKILIDDTRALYVTDDSPNAEARYRARFKFDPNSLVMANNGAHYLFYGYQGASTLITRLEFRFSNGAYQLRGAVRRDNNTWQTSSWNTISDAPHSIELDWRAATTGGANNGSLTLWIDGTQKGVLSGVDNDTHRVDRIRLGAIAGLDAGTSGSYYFDAFKATRQSYIGPTAALDSVDGTMAGDAAATESAVEANVVEEDLSLDDVGIEEDETEVEDEKTTPQQQLFLPFISR